MSLPMISNPNLYTIPGAYKEYYCVKAIKYREARVFIILEELHKM